MIINISDHFTRVSVANKSPAPNGRKQITIGALFGVQVGLTVNIYDSFELQYEEASDGIITIVKSYVETKRQQCKCLLMYMGA